MAKLPELERVMNEFFEQRSELAGSGLEVLPGVVPLLNALQVELRPWLCPAMMLQSAIATSQRLDLRYTAALRLVCPGMLHRRSG